MSIVGKLLPEQVRYFTNYRDLADVIDTFDEFSGSYKLYINGEFMRSMDVWNEEAYEAGELLEAEDSNRRIVVLDYMGSVVFTNSDKPPTGTGEFHLVYTVQDAELWDFFTNGVGVGTRNADASLYDIIILDTVALANEDFDEEDFFIDDAPHQPGLHKSLQEKVENLQEIARLYPLLEIKVYP